MKLSINEKEYNLEVSPETPLLWALRDELGLTGTKFGCGKGLCGACTVWLNGYPIRSCQLPVSGLGSSKITTIEGLPEPIAKQIRSAWIKEEVPQCGYCQNGQMMSAAALLKQNAKPTEDDINAHMSGNLCRCGTYPRIKAAIKLAAQSDGKDAS